MVAGGHRCRSCWIPSSRQLVVRPATKARLNIRRSGNETGFRCLGARNNSYAGTDLSSRGADVTSVEAEVASPGRRAQQDAGPGRVPSVQSAIELAGHDPEATAVR